MHAFKTILFLITLSSINAFAQVEFSGKLGMTANAFNLGVDYVKSQGDYGMGGFLFMQSAREQNGTLLVNGLTSFGGIIKLVVIEKSTIKAYVAPGVGITMVKDGSINGLGRKSDETVIGSIFKIGVQFVQQKGFSIGMERMQLSNWLNDSINNFAGPAEYYSVVGTWVY